ncbi:Mg-chelatase subunit ChlD [Porphyromonas gingivalis AJW4]|uniref:Aerotolerance-related membrane protein BatA n=3 Tax=Porphyromonas gingivalis TaxID=837 RepID=B2RI53_PORG3|nr:VWA domain-containing protein [Porphyromonas gingivalis]EOA09745.1 von Willebrand factor type A domain protein [Porphyromonas gingivalis JCVI SC001]AIJ35157.1 aerotolerance regulator BatA [Porphyromonas gingivalis]ALA93031.1 Mg-chelatase subunit ChlD [Porphyromonas gingivalis AJW4]ALJ24980.1 Mg-chelatase subunit ChlD [Porphyromonas gingivalis 381]ATR94987.1 VWA domain-containing protein [Porphyromonas gingivalis]
MTFAYPELLWLLILLPLIATWYILQARKTSATMTISSLKPFEGGRRGLRVYLRHSLPILRALSVGFLIIALARPQNTNSWQKDSIEGIDIMLAMDVSGSMQAMDFKPNRLEAAKDVAISFINNRPNDNIGMVTFAGESFTQCPLTTDHTVLLNMVQDLQMGVLDDGTAIGMGLATAVNRLKDSKAKSRVVILLTDGSNNMGDITPRMAADIARTFGIRVYTVGVGTRGEAPFPIQTEFGVRIQNVPVDIDEPTLDGIAEVSGGKYFRAVDNETLNEIYKEIDKLEKTRLMTKSFKAYEEKYFVYALIAFLLLLTEFLLRNTLLRSNP